jgi:hypothetical protein
VIRTQVSVGGKAIKQARAAGALQVVLAAPACLVRIVPRDVAAASFAQCASAPAKPPRLAPSPTPTLMTKKPMGGSPAAAGKEINAAVAAAASTMECNHIERLPIITNIDLKT